MITVSRLQRFDSEPWDRFARWARTRAATASASSAELTAEAARLVASWPDRNGGSAAARLRARAAEHRELADRCSTASEAISVTVDNLESEQTNLNRTIADIAKAAHLSGPSETGTVTTTCELDLLTVVDTLVHRVMALQLTNRVRTTLVHATGLDNQAALLLNGVEGEPTAADGPLDLSDAGIRLQAEVNSQDRYGSCVSLAILLGLAKADPGFVRRHLQWDPRTKTYLVTLYKDGERTVTRVDPARLPREGSDVAGTGRRGTHPGSHRPTWLTVYEQAIEQVFEDVRDPQSLPTVMERITGRSVWSAVEPSVQDIERVMAQDPPGTVVACTSGGWPQPPTVDPALRLVPNHCYTVLGIDANGNVVLQNPWGPSGGYDDDRHCPGVVRLTPAQYHTWFGGGAAVAPR